jgi:anti-sigma B factor antagonist
MPEKPTYWVRSKQPNEIGVFGRRPVPAHFNKLEDAKQYRRELNLRKGPFHPGYVIEEQVSLPGGFFWNSTNRAVNSSGGAMPVEITSRLVSGVVILDITGRLCFLEVALRDQVNELLDEGHRGFVLNLAGVPYIDSFGLGQLVSIWTSIRSQKGKLVLLQPTDHVQQLLELTKLNAVFHILGEEAQAVTSARMSFTISA